MLQESTSPQHKSCRREKHRNKDRKHSLLQAILKRILRPLKGSSEPLCSTPVASPPPEPCKCHHRTCGGGGGSKRSQKCPPAARSRPTPVTLCQASFTRWIAHFVVAISKSISPCRSRAMLSPLQHSRHTNKHDGSIIWHHPILSGLQISALMADLSTQRTQQDSGRKVHRELREQVHLL